MILRIMWRRALMARSFGSCTTWVKVSSRERRTVLKHFLIATIIAALIGGQAEAKEPLDDAAESAARVVMELSWAFGIPDAVAYQWTDVDLRFALTRKRDPMCSSMQYKGYLDIPAPEEPDSGKRERHLVCWSEFNGMIAVSPPGMVPMLFDAKKFFWFDE